MSGPYIRMETPQTSCRFLDLSRVTIPEEYLAWQVERLLDRGDLARQWACDLEALARVEHGRWCTSCVNCTSTVFTHPIWKLACCAECGCVMRKVMIPSNYREIELVLLERPRRETQNWVSSETLDDLLKQNLEHAV